MSILDLSGPIVAQPAMSTGLSTFGCTPPSRTLRAAVRCATTSVCIFGVMRPGLASEVPNEGDDGRKSAGTDLSTRARSLLWRSYHRLWSRSGSCFSGWHPAIAAVSDRIEYGEHYQGIGPMVKGVPCGPRPTSSARFGRGLGGLLPPFLSVRHNMDIFRQRHDVRE
jgi:hypothetical protein